MFDIYQMFDVLHRLKINLRSEVLIDWNICSWCNLVGFSFFLLNKWLLYTGTDCKIRSPCSIAYCWFNLFTDYTHPWRQWSSRYKTYFLAKFLGMLIIYRFISFCWSLEDFCFKVHNHIPWNDIPENNVHKCYFWVKLNACLVNI